MMRLAGIAVLLGLAAGLSACSSGPNSVVANLAPLARASLGGAAEAPAQPLTRAQLDQIPYATISFQLGDGQKTYLVPTADNNGRLTYLSQNRRGLIMLDGAIAGTKALGQDLWAVLYAQDDPIAHVTPLSQWPGSVYRSYQYGLRDSLQYAITLDCTYRRVARETITIAEVNYDTVRMAEICTNSKRQVTNTYWVDPFSGFIWKSVQWVGPHLDPITIEIIHPYTG